MIIESNDLGNRVFQYTSIDELCKIIEKNGTSVVISDNDEINAEYINRIHEKSRAFIEETCLLNYKTKLEALYTITSSHTSIALISTQTNKGDSFVDTSFHSIEQIMKSIEEEYGQVVLDSFESRSLENKYYWVIMFLNK